MIRVGSSEDHGLALDAIQIDGGTQSRANVNQHVVDDYSEAIKAGATFPPIVVFYDGKKHWLADGFHRFHAYRKIGREKVAADVRQGTRRDAILHSVGANETHGLRRTRDDKRRAVLTLLNDAEWSKWSDRDIARRCNVDHKTVASLRPSPEADTGEIPQSETRTYVHPKTGKPTTMKTAGINAGRKNAPEGPQSNDEPSPEAGPQAEASHVGTDAGMPADREGRREGETASVDLPTVSDEEQQFSDLMKAWNAAGQGVRIRFMLAVGYSDEDDLGTQDRDTLIERSGGIAAALSAVLGVDVEIVKENSPSAAPTAETVAAPQAPRAAMVPHIPDPHLARADDRQPSPRANVPPAQKAASPCAAAGQDGREPVIVGGEFAQQSAGAPQGRNEPASDASASVSRFNNPRCRHPETCSHAHLKTTCHDCTMAWAARPKAEQVLLWQEALAAESEAA